MNRNAILTFAWLAAAVVPCSAEVPKGWGFHNPSNGYTVARDETTLRDGRPGVAIRPLVEKPFEDGVGRFGILYQTISAEKYRGKRIRYSAWVKYKGIETSSDLWIRVDRSRKESYWYDAPSGDPLSFDRMDLSWAGGWEKVEIVVDVPEKAEAITFGFSLYGNGAVWVNGIELAAVGKEVPLTKSALLPEEPVNPF